MAVLIELRRDTSTNWAINNPVLSNGELGISSDLKQFKIGNGSSTWSELEYVNALPSQYLSLAVASATYDVLGSASAAEFNAKAYADSVIANLIDSAPDALNTLNELAAAINDDPNFFNRTIDGGTP